MNVRPVTLFNVSVPVEDQRANPRPANGLADIGAIEIP